jgi:hypothetical protein
LRRFAIQLNANTVIAEQLVSRKPSDFSIAAADAGPKDLEQSRRLVLVLTVRHHVFALLMGRAVSHKCADNDANAEAQTLLWFEVR